MNIVQDIKSNIEKTYSVKDHPELYGFSNYIHNLDRREIIKYEESSKDKSYLFIPAANGGSIAALAILICILSGNNVCIRIPRRGLGIEMKSLIDIFLLQEELSKKITILTSDEFQKIIDSGKKNFEKLLAWGSYSTKPIIQDIAKKISVDMIYFGSNSTSCIFDIDLFNQQNKAKKAMLVDSLISDILTFDQNGCTSCKYIYFKSINKLEMSNFLREINKTASNSRHVKTLSLQSKMSVFFQSSINKILTLGEKKFISKDRIWFVNFSQLNSNSNIDFDKLSSGIVGYTLLDDVEIIRKIDFSSIKLITQFCQLPLENLIPDLNKNNIKIKPVGQANSLDFVWDGVDLISLFD